MLNSNLRALAIAAFLSVTTILACFVTTEKGAQQDASSQKPILWMDPGDVASLDFKYGVGGSEHQPQPPFRFLDEDLSGSRDKINVIDSNGVHWNLKWGHEVLPSTFCTRLTWACGFVTEAEYFVPQGRIEGVHRLSRARSRVARDGSFVDARFQLRSGPMKYLKDHRWTWTDNPFLGTHELQGLKLLAMLVSDADAKNTNLGIFSDERDPQRYLYAISDWGRSLGKWGNLATRTMRDCKGFSDQSSKFVAGVQNGRLLWNFNGVHRSDLTDGISVSDVQWLLQYLGKVTDQQIRIGLAASGASPEETNCYAAALRERINQLQKASEQAPGLAGSVTSKATP
jgi:hypothetical protein